MQVKFFRAYDKQAMAPRPNSRAIRVHSFSPSGLQYDQVPFPPVDSSWVDRQSIYQAQHGYPQTSLNAEPEHIPPYAVHLQDQVRMAQDDDETFYQDELPPWERSVDGNGNQLVVLLLAINAMLLLLLLLRK